MQITEVKNAAVVDENHPFKTIMSKNEHQDVPHIPSVQNSSTGQRHPQEDAQIGLRENNM